MLPIIHVFYDQKEVGQILLLFTVIWNMLALLAGKISLSFHVATEKVIAACVCYLTEMLEVEL